MRFASLFLLALVFAAPALAQESQSDRAAAAAAGAAAAREMMGRNPYPADAETPAAEDSAVPAAPAENSGTWSSAKPNTAGDAAPADSGKPVVTSPPKKAEVPYREDAGLITVEYYLATGKYAQALQVIETVVARHPDCADAYVYRGFAYMKLGDNHRAQEALNRAVGINPGHLGANKYLADIYLQQGDLDRALDQMQVMHMTCGNADCQEMNELQAEINRYKNGQREAPAPKAPATDHRYSNLNH
jgi:tetratricopeptide (TPR) repeat protein